MKKRLMGGILAFALLFALPVGEVQAAKKYGDYEYDILTDGTVEILNYCPSYSVDHLVIPETIEGYTVTAIGQNAFGTCTATSIVTPDTVTIIKRSAFFNCTNLKSIKLSKNLKTIEENAFYGSRKLERIAFPDGLLEIGEQAFHSCVEMDSIIVPSSLQTVGWNAFNGCKALDDVYYKGDKTQWDALAFFNSNVASQVVVHCDFDLQPGDVNGDGAKNMRDALCLYSWVSGRKELVSVFLMLADINSDAQLNARDSLGLYQSVAGV